MSRHGKHKTYTCPACQAPYRKRSDRGVTDRCSRCSLASRPERLQDALRRAQRRIDELSAIRSELVSVVRTAATDALASFSLPPVKPPRLTASKRVEETAVAVLSDWQLAKLTASYNLATLARRVDKYTEGVIRCTQIQRSDHPVKDVRVYLLGDLIEGELIFPGQAHRIEASLFRQVLSDGPRILGQLLRSLLEHFERVHVVSVIGNHGRLGGGQRTEYHPESNGDSMLYHATQQVFANEKRLTWSPTSRDGERLWYALDRVQGHQFFLFHGDQIKGGFAGWPWYGFAKKLLAWKAMYGFKYSLSGHFHTPVRFEVGGGTHWGNGTTESGNEYAAEMLAAQGEPAQWLLYVHPKRGVSAEYLVRL